MSYSRSTGRGRGVGRETPTVQVNHHQQPYRANAEQNRNPGYSTQQENFKTSSKRAHSTQSQLPAQPQQRFQQEEKQWKEKKRPFWKKKHPVSNKVKRAYQNAKLRRVLKPKNALVFLNELRSGDVTIDVHQGAEWGYLVSFNLDGHSFSGHALTVPEAKMQAAVQALRYLLLGRLSKYQSAISTSEKDEIKGELPWGSLACFALHRLCTEWQEEDNELPPHGSPQEKPLEQPQQEIQPQIKSLVTSVSNLKQEPLISTGTQQFENKECGEETASQNKPLCKKEPFIQLSNNIKRVRQEGKLHRLVNPKNALTVLNEIRRSLKFEVKPEAGLGYVVSVNVDGKTFSGRALKIPTAKNQAAEQCLKHLFLKQLSKIQSDYSTYEKDENKDDERDTESEESDAEGEPKSKKAKLEPVKEELPWGSLACFALYKLFEEWPKEESTQ